VCRRDRSLTTLQCIRGVYRQDGIRGFYRGLTASYYGIIETAIHFVIYERLRAKLVELRARRRPRDGETSPAGHVRDFVEYMAAAGTSKGIATCVGYPHGLYRCSAQFIKGEKGGKGFPYSMPSVGPGADPGVQAVSP